MHFKNHVRKYVCPILDHSKNNYITKKKQKAAFCNNTGVW